MPMDREEHERLLAELLTPEKDMSAITDIVTRLRDDKTESTTEYETITKTAEKLKNDNDALVIANSKLFRQTGILGEGGKTKEDEKKTFSETVKLSDIEKNI
jgi:Phi29 scaffolding protein